MVTILLRGFISLTTGVTRGAPASYTYANRQPQFEQKSGMFYALRRAIVWLKGLIERALRPPPLTSIPTIFGILEHKRKTHSSQHTVGGERSRKFAERNNKYSAVAVATRAAGLSYAVRMACSSNTNMSHSR